jgi:hypothetical protein
VTKLSKAHRRWLKRLATGKIPDHLWPIGINRRGQLQLVNGPTANHQLYRETARRTPTSRLTAPRCRYPSLHPKN